MPLNDLITRTGGVPVTRERIAGALGGLGVRPGQTLLTHSSLSSLGWVVGGPQAVLLALRDAVGPEGTLVMPAHSAEWSDPAEWENPPVPEAWWPVIRGHWPAFDPDTTPTSGMGCIAESFRSAPGTRRSGHPQVSVAASGPLAQAITGQHPLPFGFGPASPYNRLYELDAQILLLGTGYDSCSMLHLAEHRVGPPRFRVRQESFAVTLHGRRRWVTADALDSDAARFPMIGAAFEAQASHASLGRVGLAGCRLVPARELVDFAEGWLGRH